MGNVQDPALSWAQARSWVEAVDCRRKKVMSPALMSPSMVPG